MRWRFPWPRRVASDGAAAAPPATGARRRTVARAVVRDALGLALACAGSAWAGVWIGTRLCPFIGNYDTYSYLWSRPVTAHFWIGRSLTQRMLFRLFGSGLGAAAWVQLGAFVVAAAGLYLLLRPRRVAPALATGAAVGFLFLSYLLSVSAVSVTAEPVHMALLLLFPAVLFRARGAVRWLTLVPLGLLFLLAKNVAPYLVLVYLALHAVLRPRFRAPWPEWAAAALLAAAAVGRIAVTLRYDTSVELNTAHAIFRQVFTDDARTRRFHERYGMPLGRHVRTFRGRDVNAGSHDGGRIYYADYETMNYRLAARDRSGFVTWVREKGRDSYLRYLFLDDPLWTWCEFVRSFDAAARPGFFARSVAAPFEMNSQLTLNILQVVESPSVKWFLLRLVRVTGQRNFDRAAFVEHGTILAAGRPGRETGFFGFEPLDVVCRAARWIGFGRVWGSLLWVVAGLLLWRRDRANDRLALGAAGVLASFIHFFLGYFGDGTSARHYMPALVAHLAAACLLATAAVSAAISAAARRAARPGVGSRGSGVGVQGSGVRRGRDGEAARLGAEGGSAAKALSLSKSGP